MLKMVSNSITRCGQEKYMWQPGTLNLPLGILFPRRSLPDLVRVWVTSGPLEIRIWAQTQVRAVCRQGILVVKDEGKSRMENRGERLSVLIAMLLSAVADSVAYSTFLSLIISLGEEINLNLEEIFPDNVNMCVKQVAIADGEAALYPDHPLIPSAAESNVC